MSFQINLESQGFPETLKSCLFNFLQSIFFYKIKQEMINPKNPNHDSFQTTSVVQENAATLFFFCAVGL